MVVNSEQALQGRDDAMQISGVHAVNGNTIVPPFPDGMETAVSRTYCNCLLRDGLLLGRRAYLLADGRRI